MLDRQALRLVSPEDFRMNTTNYLSTKKASINFRTVSGRLKHLRFFSKTNRIVFLLAFLVVLLSGCPGGPGGITPPDPTAVGSDGSSEEPYGLPFSLHDFDLLVFGYLYAGGVALQTLIPGAALIHSFDSGEPAFAVMGVDPTPKFVYDRPCKTGKATFTPLGDDPSLSNFHYTAEKCYYSTEETTGPWKANGAFFFDGTNKATSTLDQDGFGESFYELDRYFEEKDVDSASDPRIPPQDFRPLLSGTLHFNTTKDERTVTTDEIIVHGHGSLRNYTSVAKLNSEGHRVSYAVNYDITQTVRDPVAHEGYIHQLEVFLDLMQAMGVKDPENPGAFPDLKSGTYELQVRTPEPFIYGDKESPLIGGAFTLNLVSHNISAEVHYFPGGYDVTYTNNGEVQTKTVQW